MKISKLELRNQENNRECEILHKELLHYEKLRENYNKEYYLNISMSLNKGEYSQEIDVNKVDSMIKID